nr:STT3 domain-containing protein [uncultured Campylobacter sp.]
MASKISGLLDKFKFSKQTLFLMLAAFVFSVVCRMYWVYWAGEYQHFFWNDQLMISTNDGYAFAEGARDMIAGFHQPNDLSYYGRSMPTLTYFLYQILPFSFESILLYMSVFFSSLIVIPVILIAKEYEMSGAGFAAALLASIANSYYNRTMAGYYDTDMLTIVLPAFSVWAMIRLAQKKNVNDLIFIPIFILINDWWYPSSYSLNFAMLGAFLLYTLIFDRKNALNYEAAILIIVALTYIDFYAKSALAVALYLAMRFRPQIWDKRVVAACLALAVGLLGFSGGLNQILFQLKFYVFRGVSESSEPVFHFYNVNKTIMEMDDFSFEFNSINAFAKRISGHIATFTLSLVGIAALCLKFRSFLLALPMLALGFLALKGGLRFTIYSVPIMAIGFGYFAVLCVDFFKKRKLLDKFCAVCLAIFSAVLFVYIADYYDFLGDKSSFFSLNFDDEARAKELASRAAVGIICWAVFFATSKLNSLKKHALLEKICVFCIAALSLMPCLEHIYGYKVGTVFAKSEVESLDKLRKIAGREDYVLAWWDYGYPIRYYADVKTLIDGGKHLGRDNFAVSFALAANQRMSANMARLEVEYTERNFSEKFGLNLVQMMKDYNATNVNSFLYSLNDKDFRPPQKTREIYYYLPDSMLDIFSTVLRFSNLDLNSGEEYGAIFYPGKPYSIDEDTINIGGGFSVSGDASKVYIGEREMPVNTYFETSYDEKDKLVVKKHEMNADSKIYLIFMKDYRRFLVLDEAVLNSAYIQLFVLENYDKELFEPVVLNGAVKIYRLLR